MMTAPITTLIKAIVVTGLMMLAQAGGALAQGSPFAPVLTVNGRAITNYELEQRVQFLTLLRAPGDPQEQALTGLTEDRLAAFEAARVGIKLTPDQMTSGMTEFASRATLTADEFITALGEAGVSAQTFRDFVQGGLLWREVVRAKYAGRVSISEAEIDRAIENSSGGPALRVLLSEIVIPAADGDTSAALTLARRLQREINSEATFGAAARTHSAAASAAAGGRLDWAPLSNLPPAVAAAVLALSPGQVSDPLIVPNAVVLFQLRGIQEDASAPPAARELDYVQFLMPDSPTFDADAAQLRNATDTCADLYAYAMKLPEDRLTRDKRPIGEVPQDVALELAKLDQNEVSTSIRRGGFRVYLMLCSRFPATDAPINRDNVRTRLVNQRLAGLAEGFMEELRSEAFIVTP